jgi:hypothetical protein
MAEYEIKDLKSSIHIDTLQDPNFMEFRIRIDIGLNLYECFDNNIRTKLSKAISDRDKVAYMEVLTELVRRLEKKNG